jgi:tRNA threonylcarbamoyladenosine biosynthesis protein TsaB
MALILNIDTATEHASVCFSKQGQVIAIAESKDQKNHAAFVQPAIGELASQHSINLQSIDAVAVTAGPGSYTGLRVGMASAKGICYAIQKPLILINTLEVMAQAMMQAGGPLTEQTLLCPMIDARRMEVFCAIYNQSFIALEPARALILEPGAFGSFLNEGPVLFSGSGAAKLKPLVAHPNAYFYDSQHTAGDLAARAWLAFQSGRFADLAYAEPLYVKEFFDTSRQSK